MSAAAITLSLHVTTFAECFNYHCKTSPKKRKNDRSKPRASTFRLFLLGSGLLLLSLLPLLPLALVPLVGASDPQGAESVLLLLGGVNGALGDGLSGDSVDLEEVVDTDDLGGLLDLLSGRVSLLGGLGVAGEDNELAPVLVQPGNVDLQRLDRGVLAAVVDGDTDGQSELAGDTSLLCCVYQQMLSCKPTR